MLDSGAVTALATDRKLLSTYLRLLKTKYDGSFLIPIAVVGEFRTGDPRKDVPVNRLINAIAKTQETVYVPLTLEIAEHGGLVAHPSQRSGHLHRRRIHRLHSQRSSRSVSRHDPHRGSRPHESPGRHHPTHQHRGRDSQLNRRSMSVFAPTFWARSPVNIDVSGLTPKFVALQTGRRTCVRVGCWAWSDSATSNSHRFNYSHHQYGAHARPF